jgi:hypothetical protein
MALNVYTDSKNAKESLLTQYFRAYASGDSASLADLTSEAFTNDLGIETLARGTYELYELTSSTAGAMRFIMIMEGNGDARRAIVADMLYKRSGFSNRIESIKLVDQGSQLKE